MKYLQFDTNRDNLVGGNQRYHHNFLEFKKEFPQQDDLVVVVESENVEKNRQFVERLGAKLEAETNLFKDVFYKGDLAMMGSKALLFVPENDLAGLRDTLKDDLPFIEKFSQTTNLVSFFELVNTQFRTAKREENAQNDVADQIAAGAGAHLAAGAGQPRTARHAALAGRDGPVRRRRRGDGGKPTSPSTTGRFSSSPRTRRATT